MLLIIHWFLYIDIFILLTLHLYSMYWLLHLILIFTIHYSTRFSLLQTTSPLLHNWNNSNNQAWGGFFSKVFHWTNCLAFESQKFLSMKCFMKAQSGPATLFKKRLWHSCFPVNFAKFSRKHLWTTASVLRNPPKSSVNVCLIKLFKKHKKSYCVFL